MTLVLKCFQELFSWTLPLTRLSYGRYDHEDWCTHKTSLCTWNLERRNLDENKPDTALEVSSCLMCTAFHPTNPALIAGGTYTGEEKIRLSLYKQITKLPKAHLFCCIHVDSCKIFIFFFQRSGYCLGFESWGWHGLDIIWHRRWFPQGTSFQGDMGTRHIIHEKEQISGMEYRILCNFSWSNFSYYSKCNFF